MKKSLEKVRVEEPLVQCITNFVTVNDCANILLASGASPTMAMDIREVEESVETAEEVFAEAEETVEEPKAETLSDMFAKQGVQLVLQGEQLSNLNKQLAIQIEQNAEQKVIDFCGCNLKT